MSLLKKVDEQQTVEILRITEEKTRVPSVRTTNGLLNIANLNN